MKEIREQITVTGFQRSRLFKYLLFPPCFPLSPPVHRNVQRKREINADTRSESFSLQNVCPGKFIHHNSPRIAAINASTSRQHDGHCQPSTSTRKPRCPVRSTKRSHAVLLSRVIRATIVRIRCLINSWMAGQRLKCRYTPTPNAHESPVRALRRAPSSFLSLSTVFRHGCVRACPGLEVVGVRCALRVGTDEPTWGHRESGYYRQTLIWSRPGLPSNFRALTRPLTRLSVNAPKRRDAFSTPAFYRHGEELAYFTVQPTATYVSMYRGRASL